MKNIKLLLSAVLMLFCASVQAEEITEGFEDVSIVDANGNAVSGNYTAGVGLSNGWVVVDGGICKAPDYSNFGLWSTAYSGSVSLTAQYGSSNSAIVVIPQQLSGTFTFWARKTASSSSTKGYIYIYEMEEDGTSFKKAATLLNSPTLTTTWTKYTVDLGDGPHYVGINMIRAGVDDVVYNTYEVAAGPRLSVLQSGKAVKNGSSYDFGLVADAATVEYTVKNAGTETMNATLACTGNYSVSDASVSLAAGEEKTITITQSAETFGTQSGTLTISPEGLDAFTLNLGGIVRDPAKLYAHFKPTPAGWNMGGWEASYDGYAMIGYNYYYSYSTISDNKAMVTPLLKVEEGESLFIRIRKASNTSSAALCFWASPDGATWTKVGANVTAAEYDVWENKTITGFPTNTKYVAISGQYMEIDDFYGFALSSDPVMTIVGETVVDNVIAQNFGKCKANATKAYTIKNIGAGALHVDLTNSNTTDFTVSETSLDVAAGESATFDLAFNFSTEYGTKTSTVTLTPNAGEVVTINVTAAAQDPEEFTEDFENGIPESWTNKGWTIEKAPSYGNGTKMAYSGYSNPTTLISPRLQANAGDIIDIQALQKWNDEPLTLEYSLDNGATWTVGFSELPAADNTLHTLHFTAPEDGIYLLRFSGRYNYIDNICGFKLAQIPVMDVTTTCGAIKDGDVFADNFGRQTANASHTYTVKNTGAGTLTVAIASNNVDFTVSESELTMGAGESKTFDVTFVHSNVYGAKAAEITIDPTYDGLATVTINATANCADPDAFFEDFENGMPAGWNNYGWTLQTQSGSRMIYSNTSDEYKLTTPLLKAVKDEVLTFDTYQKWDDEPLKLEYSLNGAEWVIAFEEAPAANNTARQFEFTAPADGIYLLRFSGSYNFIDNVCGFKLAPATELEASEYPVNLNWATLCYPADVTLAEGMKAYKATDVVNGVVELVEVETTVPAYEPVLLYCAETAVLELPATSYVYNGAPSIKNDGNIFVGCLASSTLNQSNQYILQKQNDEVAFYRVNPEKPITTVPYRCYLETESTEAAKLGIAIDETTGISEVKAENRNDIYDLSGRKVEKMQKGVIYIINNHKVIIK